MVHCSGIKCPNNNWVHFECMPDSFKCHDCAQTEVQRLQNQLYTAEEANAALRKQIDIAQHIIDSYSRLLTNKD